MSENARYQEYIGRGLSFPLQMDARGGIALATGQHDIEQAIRIILMTAPGERIMRPEFGCRIHELVFAPHDPSTEGLAGHYVEEALAQWEPRIDVRRVEVSMDVEQDGVLMVQIHYQIKDTHDERSIVYPFFLVGEEPSL